MWLKENVTAAWIGAVWVWAYYFIPPVQQALNLIHDSISDIAFFNDVTYVVKEYTLSIWIISHWIILGTWLMYWKHNEKKKHQLDLQEQLEKDQDNMFALTAIDIKDKEELIIRTQNAKHITNVFEEPVISQLIIDRANETSREDIIIPFTEEEARLIRQKTRGNQDIDEWRHTQEIADRNAWIIRWVTTFVWMFTKAPKYKAIDSGVIYVVDKGEWESDTASKIRLIMTEQDNIDRIINWCKVYPKINKNIESFDEALDCICSDPEWNCEVTDEYIRYMLCNNPIAKTTENLSELFSNPTHRTYMTWIAQIARYVRNWWVAIRVDQNSSLALNLPLMKDIISSILKSTVGKKIPSSNEIEKQVRRELSKRVH